MIIAICAFLTASNLIATSTAHRTFPDRASCVRFLAESEGAIETTRARHQARAGEPVSAVARCVDLGRGA